MEYDEKYDVIILNNITIRINKNYNIIIHKQIRIPNPY